MKALKTRWPVMFIVLLTFLCAGCPSPNTPNTPYGTYGYGGNPLANFFSFLRPPYPSPPPYSESNPTTRGFPLMFEASWSPDGQQLALLAYPNSTSTQPPRVYLIDVASGQIRADWAIYNPAALIIEYPYMDQHPLLNWATDGSLLLLQQGGRYDALERVFLHHLRAGAPVETEVIELPLRYNDPQFIAYSHPSLSPDQQHLALFEHLPSGKKDSYGEKLQLMLYDLKARTWRKVGPLLDSNMSQINRPAWSRDQMALYLSLSTPMPETYNPERTISNSRTELFRLRLSDSQLSTLFSPDETTIQSMRLSPDGRYLFGDASNYSARLQAKDFESPDTRLRFISDQSSNFDYTANMLLIELDTGRIDYFSTYLNLDGKALWHGNSRLLMRSHAYTQPQVWKFWDLQTRKFLPDQRLPDTEGLNLGSVLGLSPQSVPQLAVSLYTPCCTLAKIRTGVFLWDMDQKRLRRIGPDVDRLIKDFPGVGLHERPQYDFSQVNKDIPKPSPYTYPTAYPFANPSGYGAL